MLNLTEVLSLTEMNRQIEMLSKATTEHSGKNKELNSYEAEIEKIERKANAEVKATRNEIEEKRRLLADLKKALNRSWKAGDKAAYKRNKSRIAEIEEDIGLLINKDENIILSLLTTEKYENLIEGVLRAEKKSEKDHCKKALELIRELVAVSMESVAEYEQARKMIVKLTNTMEGDKYFPSVSDSMGATVCGREMTATPLEFFAMIDTHSLIYPIIRQLEDAAGQ